MRMLASVGAAQWAKLYDTRARSKKASMRTHRSGKSVRALQGACVVLQSRRVKELGVADIDAGIAVFLTEVGPPWRHQSLPVPWPSASSP